MNAEDSIAISGPSLLEVRAWIEALLYASAEPLSVKDLRKTIPEAGELFEPAIEELKELYAREGRGLQLVEVAGGLQITTRPECHEVVSRLLSSPKPSRLTLQALETLAVIAYRQPVTVPELMDLRGVRSASVVRTLLEKKLVRIVGRKPVVGRPLLYGTTQEFLLRFGLKDLRDLPQLKDMSEVFGDDVAKQLEGLEPETAPASASGGPDPAAVRSELASGGQPPSGALSAKRRGWGPAALIDERGGTEDRAALPPSAASLRAEDSRRAKSEAALEGVGPQRTDEEPDPSVETPEP